jgi:hypothetical protein
MIPGDESPVIVEELVTLEKYDDASGQLVETMIIRNGVIESHIIHNTEDEKE